MHSPSRVQIPPSPLPAPGFHWNPGASCVPVPPARVRAPGRAQVLVRAPREARRRCAHNADHLARDSPLLAFVAEVVCTLGTTLPRTATSPTQTATSPPRTVASPPANGGNCSIRAATRRRHAEGMLLMLQNPPSSPGCGGVVGVNCVPELPASQTIWPIKPMSVIFHRGGLHCGRRTAPNRGLTASKRGELQH